MNIFAICFRKNFSKLLSKTHHIAPFFGGACPRTPLANAWLRHTLHGASRQANSPTFPKIF